MNFLAVGLADKHFDTDPGFLLLDDGPIANAMLDRFPEAIVFNPRRDTLNPLPMKYRRAREFALALYGEEGKTTLSVRDGMNALTWKLMHSPRLDKLKRSPFSERGEDDAQAIIDGILLSPLLKKVLCSRLRSFDLPAGASIIAKLDRAQIGETDAKILGALLISQFKGQIIVPDFGFYAREFHASLIREKRLMAGVYTLSELPPKLRTTAMLMPKVGRQCTFEDATVLAQYAGLRPDPQRADNPYNAFIEEVMSPSRAE